MEGRIGFITLDDPPANRMADPDFVPREILESWLSGEKPHGLIIKGAGRNFSTGGDPKKILRQSLEDNTLDQGLERGKGLLACLRDLEIPVVAAINGLCFGGGLEIALSCHIRVAAMNALFAFPEVNSGLMPGLGGTRHLPTHTGTGFAVRMILEGDTVDAATAEKYGLADFIAPKNGAIEYSTEMLSRMVSGRDLKVINAIMQSFRNFRDLPPADAEREETRLFCGLAASEAIRRNQQMEKE